ncbi:integrase [Mycobacterium phage Taj]|uniref:Integrase n=5 Tax=Gracegardnervirinae TaxID=2946632 RepID=A0A385DZR1_9CAUD|nr:integrase [Mycobacterium phage Wee]YP_009016936.1 integrase [Mycobacterium phage DeadP]YP_009100157.1 integrase [Mycobacterium phage Taj]YP_009124234.1 integrase [Mycobacterium phage Estave1]YP_009841071.1 integrase [Mycobacterium phage Renaud18]ADU15920.1 integrase [Mycobacterium phage Wee]AER47790.1 integrase [Mycobacterium phage DeadP]AFO10170.1 integrase [Mycobacterium phage Taj]AIM40433.1 integrase [Mycobacterium phage Estave1]AXQ64956.1 integrase [Mycobacterium phage Renaud18]
MAFIRPRKRAHGIGYAVLHKVNGQQTSLGTFDDEKEAEEFRDAVNSIGAEKAMLAWGITPTKQAARRSTAPTVSEWLERYINSRTGVTKTTLHDYSSYLKHDIAPVLGAIPIDLLTSDDIAAWVQGLAARELAGKTIANRHGFLSAALNAAVAAHEIPHNPAIGTRIPRTERKEMCFLTRDEFNLLLAQFAPRWQPLVRFMVASGARFGEVSALRPADVDRTHNTVYIGRGWKRTYDGAGYELGAPKTKRSVRTISVHPALLGDLDYSGEFLFTNTVGKPLRAPGFRSNVWYPAVEKACAAGLAKKPRIHDMRHTCASWMIAGGANMYAVQRHLGHESIQTTISLYTHLDRSDSERAAKIIGDALGI